MHHSSCCGGGRRRFVPFSFTLVGFVGLVGLLALPAQGQVDLAAAYIVGPQQVHTETNVVLTIGVASQGDPLLEEYTAEVVLTEDEVIDALDPVIASIQSSFIGPQTILGAVPDLPVAQYNWGLRVLRVKGELDVLDNETLGVATTLYKTDLSVADPSPITVTVRQNDPVPAPISMTVENVGTPTGILIFAVGEITPVPWLNIEPPQSFAIAGQPGNDVSLRFDHTGLSPGVHATTLRFQNILVSTDFQDVDVTLQVDEIAFLPGHVIVGQVALPEDVDEIAFMAVAGESLKLSVQTQGGNLKPTISMIDPLGAVEAVLKFKKSKSSTNKKVKLGMSGEYFLRIEGANGSVGGYAIKTGMKLPKQARPRQEIVKGSGSTDVTVLCFEDSGLQWAGSPNATFQGPLTFALMTPTGTSFDISGNAVSGSNGGLAIEGLTVDETGAYTIQVGGFGADPKEKVKVFITPAQPPLGQGTIFLE